MKGLNKIMKKYSIKELADILHISYVAVKKKIKPDEHNPDIIRYKNRYMVINEKVRGRDTAFILLEDDELQNEIKEANVNKTVYKTSDNVKETCENVQETYNNDGEIIDVSPLPLTVSNNELMEFTERYIERYEEVIKEYNDELREKDKKLCKYEANEGILKEKLKSKNLIVCILFALFIILLYCYITLYNKVNKTVDETVQNSLTNVSETVTNVQQPVAVQAPQPARNVSNQRKR